MPYTEVTIPISSIRTFWKRADNGSDVTILPVVPDDLTEDLAYQRATIDIDKLTLGEIAHLQAMITSVVLMREANGDSLKVNSLPK